MISPAVHARPTLLFVALLLPFCALAQDKAAPAKKKAKPSITVPKLDLSGLGGVPTGEGLEAKKDSGGTLRSRSSDPGVSYSVVEIVHALGFSRSANGARPEGALSEITLYGNPPVTQKFTTLVRVVATQPVNTSIELVILDPRGDTALSGAGELSFRGNTKGEVDYLMDWAPTPHPKGGEFKLLVRIGGKPMGTWPLKVVTEKR